jgi:hypothetical protein
MKTDENHKIKKMRNSIAKLLFPVWNQCAELEHEEFWRQLFNNFSVGKSPRSLSISGKGEIYKFTKPPTKPKLLISISTQPEKIITDSKKILSKIIGKQTETLLPISVPVYKSWNSIRKRNIREILILEYLSGMLQHKSIKELRILYKMYLSYLDLGIACVDFQQGKIKNIEQASFQKEKPDSPKPVGLLVSNFWRAKRF